MPHYNHFAIAGHLTRDVELKNVGEKGTALATTSIAYSEKYSEQEKTSFFDVKVWGKPAEILAQYCAKGSPVLLAGKLEQERWDDKETGKARSKVVLVARDVVLLGSKKADEEMHGTPPSSRTPDAELDANIPF